jgi:indole-3-glycerol phosphate synthase
VSGETPSVLARILRSTRAELEQRKLALSTAELHERLGDDNTKADAARGACAPRGFRRALIRPSITVIAEFKRRSPSAGDLREGAELEKLAPAYERGGASALSVLTEQPNFGGSLADLSAARELVGLPVLRKDFIVDEYQLLEARLAGADAVLLIVAALSDDELASLHRAAGELALDVLVEVHDREEVTRALAVGAELIGVNNRDLRDFSVDIGRTSQLRGAIPSGVAVVSESGIASPEQLRSLAGEGVDAVLVGETLMRAGDPERALRALLSLESETASA